MPRYEAKIRSQDTKRKASMNQVGYEDELARVANNYDCTVAFDSDPGPRPQLINLPNEHYYGQHHPTPKD